VGRRFGGRCAARRLLPPRPERVHGPQPAQRGEYLVVPFKDAGDLKKNSGDLSPNRLNHLGSQGWEAVGLSLKRGDLVAWPVVPLKRPRD
jgi:hypothetical protein